MSTALKTRSGFQPGEVVHALSFPYEEGTGSKPRYCVVIARYGKQVEVRGIFSRMRDGRVRIPADIYNNLHHDSFLESSTVTIYVSQVTERIGEVAYDFDPFNDF